MQTRISQCNPLVDSDAHGAGPVWGSGAYSLLHTNYKRSGPFREEVFFFVYSKSMGTNDPGEGAIFHPRCMNGRIYVYLIIILLHTIYTSFGYCGFN